MPYDEDGNFIYPMPRRRGKAANPPAARPAPKPLPVAKNEPAQPVETPAAPAHKEDQTPAIAPPTIVLPLPASAPTFTVHEGNNRWQMSELDLAQIWNAQIWPAPLKLVTTTGQPVEIIYRGRWSGGFGPDFKGAMVKIGDILLKGAIELHLRSGDWRLHGHHQDARYNEVVLQVVLW